MALRIPLTSDQTLQTEFHEIERRLKKLERRTGITAGSSITTIQSFGTGGASSPNLNPILARLDAIETALANLPEMDDVDFAVFGGVGPTASSGAVPAPETHVPPTGIADEVLQESATWGFPFRGLAQVETSGAQLDIPYDVLDLNAGLHVGHVSAANVSCYDLRTHGDVEYINTFWDDLRFPAQGVNPIGSPAPPGIDTSTGCLSFAGNADNVMGGLAQLPHSWKRGTDVHPHIHLRFSASNPGTNTRWKFAYDFANLDGNFVNAIGTFTSLPAVTVANPASTVKHVYADLGDVPMTGKTESCVIIWQVWRLAASDGADNDTGACLLLEFDLHFEIGKPGSSDEIP